MAAAASSQNSLARSRQSVVATEEYGNILRPEMWTQAIPIKDVFPDGHPLELDIGCGKGRFLLARAAANPEINYIGIDRMTGRIHKVDRRIARAELTNVRILHTEAAAAVQHLFPQSSVSAAYVFFPDPWPKRRHHRRRLFGSDFMDSLHRLLKADAVLHVATDHTDYFAHIAKVITADPRFEPSEVIELREEERTDFEIIFLGNGEEISRGAWRKS
jgi:tRNA (guanine-N7-)-methyltransferase